MRQPDLDNAVIHFVQNLENLKHLPFLTDQEAASLYGEEVTEAITELELFNQRKQICGNCRYRCCLRVKCELYDARFNRCLVETCRPALCRMHFCDKFNQEYASLVKILGDIFLEGLLAAQKIDGNISALFDCPAFQPLIPQTMGKINPLLADIRMKKIAEPEACSIIRELIINPGPIPHQ